MKNFLDKKNNTELRYIWHGHKAARRYETQDAIVLRPKETEHLVDILLKRIDEMEGKLIVMENKKYNKIRY